MSKLDFIDYICRPYCMFFREGEKEEMACRGAQVAQLLVASGKIDPGRLPVFEKDPAVWQRHDLFLGIHLCGVCEYRAEDCEYRFDDPPEDAEPCGGFILLALLMETNRLDEQVLETAT